MGFIHHTVDLSKDFVQQEKALAFALDQKGGQPHEGEPKQKKRRKDKNKKDGKDSKDQKAG